MKVREPVARPLDVVAAELLLSASQAFLVGVLVYLAVGVWDDRGVGFGPVAVIVAGLGLAVGAGWIYWLLGGMGWPLAAANVPTAMFLGFALVLGWSGEALFRVEGVPLLLSLSASVYGLVCGAFLDSPRRLRWNQRQRPRPGTPVPRVSATTQRVAAQVPRSMPRRATGQPAEYLPPRAEPTGEAVAGAAVLVEVGHEAAATRAQLEGEGQDADEAGPATTATGGAGAAKGALGATSGAGSAKVSAAATGTQPAPARVSAAAADVDAAPTLGSMMPTERLERIADADAAAASDAEPEAAPGPVAIELPTSIEPRAQKSPWAWAAPPEWNRDEDDEPPRRRSAKRS